MVYSDETEKVDFLIMHNFKKKRSCFEFAIRKEHLLVHYEAVFKKSSDKKYLLKMFEHYKKEHEAVSPLTVSFKEFRKSLPDEFYIDQEGNGVFVEGSEIAYFFYKKLSSFERFISAFMSYMLEQYDEIFFEVDDTDKAFEVFEKIIDYKREKSYDTYILELVNPV